MKRTREIDAEMVGAILTALFGLLILVPYIGCLAGAKWALWFCGVQR